MSSQLKRKLIDWKFRNFAVRRVHGLNNAPDPYRKDCHFESRHGLNEYRNGARMSQNAGVRS